MRPSNRCTPSCLHDTVAGAFFMAERARPMSSLTISMSRPLDDAEFERDLHGLICLRARQLQASSSLVRFVVVQGGDTPDVINTAVGFPITGNLAEPARPDWIWDHGLWFEIAYGAGGHELIRIFVENGPGTELGIHYFCLSDAWIEGGEGAR